MRKVFDNADEAVADIPDAAVIMLGGFGLCGITIGEGALIGAGSMVTKDVPAHTLVAGNPARILRKLDQPKS